MHEVDACLKNEVLADHAIVHLGGSYHALLLIHEGQQCWKERQEDLQHQRCTPNHSSDLAAEIWPDTASSHPQACLQRPCSQRLEQESWISTISAFNAHEVVGYETSHETKLLPHLAIRLTSH